MGHQQTIYWMKPPVTQQAPELQRVHHILRNCTIGHFNYILSVQNVMAK